MMISLETKTQAAPSFSLIAPQGEEEASKITLTFTELLKGFSNKNDDKLIQKGTLVVASDKDAKDINTLDLAALTETKVGATPKDTPLELNPQLTQNLTPTELKALANDAKTYLKRQITQSEGFKKAEIQKLPKTLKGLVSVAKKFGLDMSKIRVEDVKADAKNTTKLDVSPQKTVKELFVSKELTSSLQLQQKKETPPKKTLKDMLVVEAGVTKPTKTEEPLKKETKQIKVPIEMQETAKIETHQIEELPKKIREMPLFKAQTKVEITTEQLVNTKLNTITEKKESKQKTDTTFQILLHGKKAMKSESNLTADFSVAAARVIAPEAKTEKSKSLESLLHGDEKHEGSSHKIDGLNIPKADSFDLKLHEAKQMTKYLSHDVKNAIENYKAPFTRVKVQLNPQKLGEVDVTIVQRGKNLHINLNSNNTAINTLALNANDLKLQLTNNGINNATLNFNNNSQNSEQSSFGQQQQNSQQRQQAQDEYNYFDNEEKNEEIVNSLEIVVPNYA